MWTRAQRTRIVACLMRHEAISAASQKEARGMKEMMPTGRQAHPLQAFALSQSHRLVLHQPYH